MISLNENIELNKAYKPLCFNRYRFKVTAFDGSIEFFFAPSLEEVKKMYFLHYPEGKAKFELSIK